MASREPVAPFDHLESRIFLVRGHKVMLSTDLAALYGVEPRALVQAVKRNRDRFPSDFMFQLTAGEFADLKSQIVTSSWGGLRRAMPYGFTEQGVAMLSSVLRSKRAIQVNIEVIPTIGLILCQEHGRLLAEYSFAGIDKPIGISTYQLTRALPRDIQSALPTVEEIEAELGKTLNRPERPHSSAPKHRKTTASHLRKK